MSRPRFSALHLLAVATAGAALEVYGGAVALVVAVVAATIASVLTPSA